MNLRDKQHAAASQKYDLEWLVLVAGPAISAVPRPLLQCCSSLQPADICCSPMNLPSDPDTGVCLAGGLARHGGQVPAAGVRSELDISICLCPGSVL